VTLMPLIKRYFFFIVLSKIFGKLYFYIYLQNNKNQVKKISELITPPKKILIISNTAFGDLLLSTPAIKSLRDSFTDVEIALLAQKQMLPLAKKFNFIDKLFSFNGGYKKFITTAKYLRHFAPDVVLILHGNYPQDIQLAYLSGAKFILKHPTNSKLKHLLSYQFKKDSKHAIDTRLDLVRKIGGNSITTTINIGRLNCNDFTFPINPIELDNKLIIGLQLGASDVFKMWPVENFIILVSMILKKHDKTIFLVTGNKKEKYLAQKLADKFSTKVLDFCGAYNIDKLPCLIRNLNMLITNDTGTLHLAIALKIPTISLFSSTKSLETGPYQDLSRHMVIQKDGDIYQGMPKKQRDNKAMKYIQPNEVYSKFEELLRRDI